MSDAVLGLDLGTTAVKAAVYTSEGRLLGAAAARYPTHRPVPDAAEQDPEDWLRAVGRAARAALRAAGRPGVAALGFSSQRDTVVPVDATLRPLRPAITWMDRRAVPEARELELELGGEAVYRLTGLWPDATYTAPKLRWLERHEPGVMGRARWLLGPRDYVVARLTGVVATDPSLASRTLLYRLDEGGWWADGLAHAGARLEQWPPVFPSTAAPGGLTLRAARALGLPEGTPVVLGGGDRPCENLGAGGGLVESTGTATAVSLALPEVIEPFARLPLTRGVLPGGYVLEPGLGPSGAILEWLRELFGLSPLGFTRLLETLGPPREDDPVLLPYLAGARGARRLAGARGVLADLRLGHSRESLVRAAMAGVAVEVAALLELLRGRGLPVDEVKAVGGGSRSPLWLGLKSGLSGVPFRPSGGDAARGAAALAAMHLGFELPPPELGPPAPAMAAPGLRERHEALLARLADSWT